MKKFSAFAWDELTKPSQSVINEMGAGLALSAMVLTMVSFLPTEPPAHLNNPVLFYSEMIGLLIIGFLFMGLSKKPAQNKHLRNHQQQGQQTKSEVLSDPCIRDFCKFILLEAAEHDPVDALNDVELAYKVLSQNIAYDKTTKAD